MADSGTKLFSRRTILAFVRARSAFFVLVLFAIVLGVLPVLLSILASKLSNPVVLAICASGQFFVSLFAGVLWSKAEAVKEANLRWVPMAASACDRLGTILGSVANLRGTVSQACSTASRNLPELSENKNRAVRIHFEGLCSSNATRLVDVESHLDSALADWERFIKQNCSGAECADIGRRLAVQGARFTEREIHPTNPGCQSSAADHSFKADHNQQAAQLHLAVSGVTLEPNRNGQWGLRRVSEDFWECDTYVLRKESFGWFVEDKSNADSYFFRAVVSGQCGVYERCAVCPHDGNAVVFAPVESPGGDARLSPSAVSDPKTILDIAISLDGYLQHEITRERLVSAIKESSNLTELAAFLGTGCPMIVSVCALPALNLVRGALERPPFVYDQALHEKLCANSESKQGAHKLADRIDEVTAPVATPAVHETAQGRENSSAKGSD
jgi:hypothetical protein